MSAIDLNESIPSDVQCVTTCKNISHPSFSYLQFLQPLP
jgi:hypothetical protein